MTVLTKALALQLKEEQGRHIVIPDTYTSIDRGAFPGDGSIPSMSNGILSVKIPDSITEIGAYAFEHNDLSTVSIPDSVTSIGLCAFSFNQLTEVDLGKKVETIDVGAFMHNELIEIKIPDSVKSVKSDAFQSNNIRSVSFGKNLQDISGFQYNQLVNVFVPDSVTMIWDISFDNNPSLETISIPSTATFYDQSLPSSVEVIRRDTAPILSPDPDPTPEPIEEDITERVESIDAIETQNKVSTFKLSKPVSISGNIFETLIVGTKNKDKIFGTSNCEILAGQAGKDVLVGGGEADGFLFNASNGFDKKEVDKIIDFDSYDVILLDKTVFNLSDEILLKVVTGKKASKKAAKSKNDFIYDDKKGLLYFNENGKDKGWGDGGLFVKLQGAPELGASDFTIV